MKMIRVEMTKLQTTAKNYGVVEHYCARDDTDNAFAREVTWGCQLSSWIEQAVRCALRVMSRAKLCYEEAVQKGRLRVQHTGTINALCRRFTRICDK